MGEAIHTQYTPAHGVYVWCICGFDNWIQLSNPPIFIEGFDNLSCGPRSGESMPPLGCVFLSYPTLHVPLCRPRHREASAGLERYAPPPLIVGRRFRCHWQPRSFVNCILKKCFSEKPKRRKRCRLVLNRAKTQIFKCLDANPTQKSGHGPIPPAPFEPMRCDGSEWGVRDWTMAFVLIRVGFQS